MGGDPGRGAGAIRPILAAVFGSSPYLQTGPLAITALLTFLAVLPFATVLKSLPLAVLGAIVIVAILGLMNFPPLVWIWRVSVPQAVIASGTFTATVLLAPRLDLAVLIGIGLSIAEFHWRSQQLDVDVMS